MAFKKYPSIDNSYQEKEMQWWLRSHPELTLVDYIIEEKIHGANFSLEFTPDGEHFIGRRKARVPDGVNFNNAHEILEGEDYQKLIAAWTKQAVDAGATYHLYGEIFGGKISKGVNYGPERRILFFDVAKDEVMFSPSVFMATMTAHELLHFHVPVLGTVKGLSEALAFSVEFNTREGPEDIPEGENVAEGVVIKPLFMSFATPQGSVFMLKKKNPKFEEKKQAKAKKAPLEVSDEAQRLRDEFESYLTETRLENLFSKEGEIEKLSQMGQYIQMFIGDAREDFLKDQGDALKAIDKKEKKYVFSVAKIVVEMLKKHL